MSEEIEKIGEQPEGAEVHTAEAGVDNGTEMQEGSPLGKFKNATKLLDAYNELQSEFTRKCQKLSEVEKKLQDVQSDSSSRVNQNDAQNEFAWKDKINEFLQSHSKASNLMEEIANEMAENGASKDGIADLEKAYVNVIEKKYIPENELAENEEFLNKYIYSNDQIKNKIISEYVSTLQNNKSPITITSDGYSRGVASSNKFGSLEDARKYVENMFRF